MADPKDMTLEGLKAQIEAMQARNAALEASLKAAGAGKGKREARVYAASSGSGYVCVAVPGSRVYSFAPTDLHGILDALKASGPLAEQARKLAESPAVVSQFVAHKAAKDAPR